MLFLKITKEYPDKKRRTPRNKNYNIKYQEQERGYFLENRAKRKINRIQEKKEKPVQRSIKGIPEK